MRWENERLSLDLVGGCGLMVGVGLTVRFTFNCILIDKDGIHHVDLGQADPIASMESKGKEAEVDAPIDVAVTA